VSDSTTYCVSTAEVSKESTKSLMMLTALPGGATVSRLSAKSAEIRYDECWHEVPSQASVLTWFPNNLPCAAALSNDFVREERINLQPVYIKRHFCSSLLLSSPLYLDQHFAAGHAVSSPGNELRFL
jgi:hypothetical protein